jgi:hypothetical protein
MRYAAAYKPDLEPLGEFIRRKGGINASVLSAAGEECGNGVPETIGRLQRRGSRQRFLRRSSVQGQQSEIVFGVLVVVLRRNDIPRPGFLLG